MYNIINQEGTTSTYVRIKLALFRARNVVYFLDDHKSRSKTRVVLIHMKGGGVAAGRYRKKVHISATNNMNYQAKEMGTVEF